MTTTQNAIGTDMTTTNAIGTHTTSTVRREAGLACLRILMEMQHEDRPDHEELKSDEAQRLVAAQLTLAYQLLELGVEDDDAGLAFLATVLCDLMKVRREATPESVELFGRALEALTPALSLMVVPLTDDCGRPLDGAPAIAPRDGYLIEAWWAGRDDCPPQAWFAPNLEEAHRFLRGLLDPHHVAERRYHPPRQMNEGWWYDLTRCGCKQSSGTARPILQGTSF